MKIRQPLGLQLGTLLVTTLLVTIVSTFWVAYKNQRRSLVQNILHECELQHESHVTILQNYFQPANVNAALRSQIVSRSAPLKEFVNEANLKLHGWTIGDVSRWSQKKLVHDAFAGATSAQIHQRDRKTTVLSIAYPIRSFINQVSEIQIIDFPTAAVQNLFRSSENCVSQLTSDDGVILLKHSRAQLKPYANEGEWVSHLAALPMQLKSFVPEEVILFENNQLRIRFIYVTGILLSLILLSAYYLHKPLADEISELRSTLQKIARGNFRARPRLNRNDELGDLELEISVLGEMLQNLELQRNLFRKWSHFEFSVAKLEETKMQIPCQFTATVLCIQFHMDEDLSKASDRIYEIIHANHGWVERFTATEAVAVFGLPELNELDASNAVLCAHQLSDWLAKQKVKFQMAVHTDSAIGIFIGRESHREFSIYGDCIEQCSPLVHIEDPALRNKFVVTETTKLRCGDFFQFQFAGASANRHDLFFVTQVK